MPKALVILILTQLIYTCSDFMGRYYMARNGFSFGAMLTSGWFWGYQFIRQIAMVGQLYVFAAIPLGRTMALLGAMSIVLANAMGFLFLKEVLTPMSYAGVTLAIIAFALMAFR